MARPTKQGIDYFPLDCNFDTEIEMYLIEKNSTGLAVLITLWQLIYSNEGYYINDNKDLKLLIKKRINVDINEIDECIKICLSRKIFDFKLHEKYKILTSNGIQKRFFDISKRKKEIKIYEEFLLNSVNVDINQENVSINLIDDSKNATKEKKSKSKSKVNKILQEKAEKYLSFFMDLSHVVKQGKTTQGFRDELRKTLLNRNEKDNGLIHFFNGDEDLLQSLYQSAVRFNKYHETVDQLSIKGHQYVMNKNHAKFRERIAEFESDESLNTKLSKLREYAEGKSVNDEIENRPVARGD